MSTFLFTPPPNCYRAEGIVKEKTEPRPGALELKLAPTWLDPIRKFISKPGEVSHAR